MVSINKAVESARFELEISINYQWALNAHNAIVRAIRTTRDRISGMIHASIRIYHHAHDHVLIHACQARQAMGARKSAAISGIRHKASSVRDILLAAALGIPAESIPDLRARILNPVPVVPVPVSADEVPASSADAVSAPKRATARKAKSYPIDACDSGMNVNAEQFRQALDRVSKAIPKRGRPILQAVYLRADGSELVMSGTDLEVTAVTRIPAVTVDFGSAIINCADLRKALKTAKGTVNLSHGENKQDVVLSIGSRTLSLTGFPIDEYPTLPVLESAWQEVPAGFLSGIGKVLPAVSMNDPREVLTGIHMQASRLVATDTHRGYIAQLGGELVGWSDCIVPARAMAMLAKVLDAQEGDSVQVRYTANQIEFRYGASSLVSRLIEGHFPNIDNVIPNDYSGSWTVNRAQLIDAVTGLSPIALENCNKLAISSNGTELIITASAGSDSASAKVPAVCDGTWHEFTLGFNCRYLLDALKVQESEQVTIEGNGEVHPVAIGRNPLLTITMPIDLKN